MVSSARQIACIVLLLGVALCATAQTPAAKISSASISGKVTLKSKGLGGVVVSLRLVESWGRENTSYQAVTDDQGNYRITGISPGNYQVLTVAPAFAIKDGDKSFVLSKDETLENIDFELERGGVITGRVTDAEGRPIIEQEVMVTPTRMEIGFPYRPFGGPTDDRGVYRIFGLPGGTYKVGVGQGDDSFSSRIDGPAYRKTYYPNVSDVNQAATVEVTAGGEATNIDITVGRTLTKYRVRGKLVDGETGKPVPNVGYGLEVYLQQGGGSMSNGAVTNQAGEFYFENLAPGKYGVSFDPAPDSEWRVDPLPFEVSDRDVTGLVARTGSGTSASGVVVLEGIEDKAIQAKLQRAFLNAYVQQPSASRNQGHTARIREDGSFRVNGLASGQLNFSLFSQDQLQIARIERNGVVVPFGGLEVKTGEAISGLRVIIAHAGGTIQGVVKLENGTPPQGTYVHVVARLLREDADPRGTDAHAQVDARGQFLFKNLLPGTYEVRATQFVPGPQGSQTVHARQQVVVTNAAVTNVTLTLEATKNRP